MSFRRRRRSRSRSRRRLLRVVDKVVFRQSGGPLRRRRRRIKVDVFPHHDVSSVSRRPKNDLGSCFATKTTPRHVLSSSKTSSSSSSRKQRLRYREHHHHHRVVVVSFCRERRRPRRQKAQSVVCIRSSINWGKKWRTIPLLFFPLHCKDQFLNYLNMIP